MRYVDFKTTITLLKEHLRDSGFLEINKNIFQSPDITLIFYYSKYNFKTRMYVLDTMSKKHLFTYFYDFNLPKACAREIKTNIQKTLFKYYDRF